MININEISLGPKSSIKEALKVMNRGAVKIVLVVDSGKRLLGTLSDGDIRRALLKKKSLSALIEDVYVDNPIIARVNDSSESIKELCKKHKILQIPIIDDDGKLISLFLLDSDLTSKQYENAVIIMGGGLGTRLMPLTKETPKPMLKVGGKPILLTIIEGFVKRGFTNIIMCLGYKSDVIKEFFSDGSQFGARIEYVIEEKRMGTAGALTLIKKKLDLPFIVMNGDILTNVSYDKLLDFHNSNNAKATMCVRDYEVTIPYGVVNTKDENIVSIQEKPTQNFFVNSGIYVLQPECISLIPKNEFYDMPLLFEKLIQSSQKTISFPLKEYWLDVGRIEQYKKANQDISSIFN